MCTGERHTQTWYNSAPPSFDDLTLTMLFYLHSLHKKLLVDAFPRVCFQLDISSRSQSVRSLHPSTTQFPLSLPYMQYTVYTIVSSISHLFIRCVFFGYSCTLPLFLIKIASSTDSFFSMFTTPPPVKTATLERHCVLELYFPTVLDHSWNEKTNYFGPRIKLAYPLEILTQGSLKEGKCLVPSADKE